VQFAAAAQSMPEVQQCFRVTGSESYVMRVATLSVAHLESFLNAMSVYGQAVTSVVLSTPVTQRVVEGAPVLLPATAGPSGKAEAHG
jgi:Lrp/AsnC family leucine-responsive transcriptional regulator